MFQLKMSGLSSTKLLLVPKSGRQEILSLAMHMRVTKTCQKILNYFYLPSLKKRRSGILQIVSCLSDGWETESNYIKPPVTAHTSSPRAS